jgi:hypothetical protein
MEATLATSKATVCLTKSGDSGLKLFTDKSPLRLFCLLFYVIVVVIPHESETTGVALCLVSFTHVFYRQLKKNRSEFDSSMDE